MKMKKLNMRGFTHTVALIAVVAVFAVAGVGYMVASHADSTCSSTSTQTINGVTTTSSSSSCNSSTCIVNGVQQASCPRPSIPTIPRPVARTATTKTIVGKITQDGCFNSGATIGDVGCSITVTTSARKTYVVRIMHGNAPTPIWGKLYGFTASTDNTGKKVRVQAVASKTQPVTYDLSSRSAYVKVY